MIYIYIKNDIVFCDYNIQISDKLKKVDEDTDIIEYNEYTKEWKYLQVKL